MNDLSDVYQKICSLMDDLTRILTRYEKFAPNMFWRPVNNMGASDKMKAASEILELLSAFKGGDLDKEQANAKSEVKIKVEGQTEGCQRPTEA